MTPEIAFAATAGMLAAFNPCGFALLPGYLAIFLGPRASTRGTVARAVVVGGAVTVGFVAVFGTVGAAVTLLSLSLGPWLSVVTLVAGLVLLVIGVLLLSGRDVSVRVPRARLKVSGSATGMVAYGVVYATVSLSCTLPVFIAAVVSVFAAPGSTAVTGTLAALAYALGMGLVMVTLAVIVGLLGRTSLTRARAWTRYVGRASGFIVTLAALYVLWYGWVEVQTYNGNQIAPGPVRWVAAASAQLSQAIHDAGTGRVFAALAAVLAMAVTATLVSRRGQD
ncbi:MAG: cytochrome c biogenesis protein CcdA [Pedococcus sp.]